jgi:hypothetical protein
MRVSRTELRTRFLLDMIMMLPLMIDLCCELRGCVPHGPRSKTAVPAHPCTDLGIPLAGIRPSDVRRVSVPIFLTCSRAALAGRYEHRGSAPNPGPLSGGEGNICSVAVGGWTHVRWSPPPAGHPRATPEPPDRARVARQRSNVRIVATLARPGEPGVGQSLPDRRRRPAQLEVYEAIFIGARRAARAVLCRSRPGAALRTARGAGAPCSPGASPSVLHSRQYLPQGRDR